MAMGMSMQKRILANSGAWKADGKRALPEWTVTV
jgi:hypothetical protein